MDTCLCSLDYLKMTKLTHILLCYSSGRLSTGMVIKRQLRGGHKTGIKIYIYHPINLHGGEIQFVNLLLFGMEPSEDNLITTVFPEYLP